jgi:hypothetical protein
VREDGVRSVGHPAEPTVGGACPLCSASRFESFRFGLLRCAGCGLVVNPALFRRGAGQVLNEEAFGEGWEPETSCWVRRLWGK